MSYPRPAVYKHHRFVRIASMGFLGSAKTLRSGEVADFDAFSCPEPCHKSYSYISQQVPSATVAPAS